MNDWRRVPVPSFCERLIGFSVPKGGRVLAISYEAVHLLTLATEVSVLTDEDFAEYDIYDPDAGTASYQREEYRIIGLHGGQPVLDGPDGELLALNQSASTLSVVRAGTRTFHTRYSNFSGDWAAATFSPDGRYIVLGCPYDFDFMVLVREETL